MGRGGTVNKVRKGFGGSYRTGALARDTRFILGPLPHVAPRTRVIVAPLPLSQPPGASLGGVTAPGDGGWRRGGGGGIVIVSAGGRTPCLHCKECARPRFSSKHYVSNRGDGREHTMFCLLGTMAVRCGEDGCEGGEGGSRKNIGKPPIFSIVEIS